MIIRKAQHFLQHEEKHENTKGAYTYGTKSIGKNVSFADVPEETSIPTAKMTAIMV